MAESSPTPSAAGTVARGTGTGHHVRVDAHPPHPDGGSGAADRIVPMRAFAPHRLGRYECDAWVCYYRREWGRFLQASVSMVREGFGMPWHRTLQGAYLVLRANQLWAPYPDNDAAGAEDTMRRFYALVDSVHSVGIDPRQAARREVEWWRVHRELQHRPEPADEEPAELTAALADLYAYIYDSDEDAVRPAAALRARAMTYSDRWVREGCDLGSPLLVEELTCLVRSYGALLEAVRPPPSPPSRRS